MTAPTSPDATPVTARPNVVTISSYLLVFYAVLQVAAVLLMIPEVNTTWKVAQEHYADTPTGDVAVGMVIGFVIVAVLSLLFAAGLVTLAVFNNRGKNPSRIITWVVAGFALCCAGVGLLLTALGTALSGVEAGDPDLLAEEEMQERIQAALPGWYEPVSLVGDLVGTLAIAAAAILLALPAANEFFRKAPTMWAPSSSPLLPGAVYPGYPAGPAQYPGYPPAGPAQYPGYPPADAAQHPGHPSAGPAQPPQDGAQQPPQDGAQQPPANPAGPAAPAGSDGTAEPTPPAT